MGCLGVLGPGVLLPGTLTLPLLWDTHLSSGPLQARAPSPSCTYSGPLSLAPRQELDSENHTPYLAAQGPARAPCCGYPSLPCPGTIFSRSQATKPEPRWNRAGPGVSNQKQQAQGWGGCQEVATLVPEELTFISRLVLLSESSPNDAKIFAGGSGGRGGKRT